MTTFIILIVLNINGFAIPVWCWILSGIGFAACLIDAIHDIKTTPV